MYAFPARLGGQEETFFYPELVSGTKFSLSQYVKIFAHREQLKADSCQL